MSVTSTHPSETAGSDWRARANGLVRSPEVVLFVSANIANAANLAFNMVFARLLGPEAFADLSLILTLKLSLLAFLSALQLAVARRVAVPGAATGGAVNRLCWRSLPISVGVMLIALASVEAIAAVFRVDTIAALAVLFLAIPAFVPMMLNRGQAQGRLALRPLVASYQLEWMVRLFGALLMWWAGFGLTGISVAIALSIVAGWAFARAPSQTEGLGGTGDLAFRTLSLAALPFMALQGAQVLMLDADVLIAKASMSDGEAGITAGLVLIQRIFFFAFLSFSMILLPRISALSAEPGHVVRAAFRRVVVQVAAVGVVFTALASALPGLAVLIVLGGAFDAAEPEIVKTAACGALFTLSHLAVTFQIARGRSAAAWVVLAVALVQVATLSLVVTETPSPELLFNTKLAFQVTLAGGLLLWTLWPRADRA